jgi:hypothetical protein
LQAGTSLRRSERHRKGDIDSETAVRKVSGWFWCTACQFVLILLQFMALNSIIALVRDCVTKPIGVPKDAQVVKDLERCRGLDFVSIIQLFIGAQSVCLEAMSSPGYVVQRAISEVCTLKLVEKKDLCDWGDRSITVEGDDFLRMKAYSWIRKLAVAQGNVAEVCVWFAVCHCGMSKNKCIVQVPTWSFMINSAFVVTSVTSPGSFEIFTHQKEGAQGIQPGVLRVGDAITHFQGTWMSKTGQLSQLIEDPVPNIGYYELDLQRETLGSSLKHKVSLRMKKVAEFSPGESWGAELDSDSVFV